MSPAPSGCGTRAGVRPKLDLDEANRSIAALSATMSRVRRRLAPALHLRLGSLQEGELSRRWMEVSKTSGRCCRRSAAFAWSSVAFISRTNVFTAR